MAPSSTVDIEAQYLNLLVVAADEAVEGAVQRPRLLFPELGKPPVKARTAHVVELAPVSHAQAGRETAFDAICPYVPAFYVFIYVTATSF